ncbi:hypothetical protein APASM_2768 [Actinosynnema pretiosum subsp. pretiosum]|nr:hypothetical protein APASM_2768 [Actinosynnema pretiosum subsp. pretiosum]
MAGAKSGSSPTIRCHSTDKPSGHSAQGDLCARAVRHPAARADRWNPPPHPAHPARVGRRCRHPCRPGTVRIQKNRRRQLARGSPG